MEGEIKQARTGSSTCNEVLVDETFDFLKLLEIRGLQEREQVPHIKLFPGHAGGGGGGGGGGVKGVAKVEGRGFQMSLTLPAVRVPGPPTDAVSRHHCRHTQTPFLSNTTLVIWSPTCGQYNNNTGGINIIPKKKDVSIVDD